MSQRKQMEPALLGRAAAEQALARAIDRHRAPPLAPLLEGRNLGAYRGYAEMLGSLRELWHRGAGVEVIGQSVRREPIFALVTGQRDAKRTSVVLSGIHPIEWIGIEAHFKLLELLVERQPHDRRVVSIVVSNPDGVLKVDANLRRRRRRFVRHNARGVDLNRNFPAHWGKNALSRLLLRPVFRPGSAPASEPETRAIVGYLKGVMIDRAVSLHSFGGVVLYPWGGLLRPALDRRELRHWAKHIARRADPHRPYRATQSSHWVPGFTAPGLEIDWLYDSHGALSLLVECSRGGVSLRPSKLTEPFAWFNPPGLESPSAHVAKAIERFIRGAVRPGE